VDHLGAQAGQRRGDPGFEPVQGPFDLSPARKVGKVGEQRTELECLLEVPEDLVVGRRVKPRSARPRRAVISPKDQIARGVSAVAGVTCPGRKVKSRTG